MRGESLASYSSIGEKGNFANITRNERGERGKAFHAKLRGDLDIFSRVHLEKRAPVGLPSLGKESMQKRTALSKKDSENEKFFVKGGIRASAPNAKKEKTPPGGKLSSGRK